MLHQRESKQKHYSRLQEEHAKALQLTRERRQKWEQFKNDYEALQSRLYTLPDQLSYDIMVPFGRFGFMPGTLYHTNEVMVLLGDNWFAKRSVKQALEVAERRKQHVIKELENERKQLEDWEARLTFTEDIKRTEQDHEEVVEIQEQYHEDNQGRRVWKARKPRHSNVPPPRPAFPKGEVHVPTKPVSSGEDMKLVDEELWRRLEELEREEEEQRTREEQEQEREESAQEEGERSVRDTQREMGDSSDDGDSDSDAGRGPLRITVKHSSAETGAKEGNQGQEKEEEEEIRELDHKPLFSSPGDIFRQHPSKEELESESAAAGDDGGGRETVATQCLEEMRTRKGVRWDPELVSYHDNLGGTRDREGREERERATSMTSKTVLNRGPVAFSGQVIERTAPHIPTAKAATKKVSKFKASRTKTST